jgi:hypothetical protein
MTLPWPTGRPSAVHSPSSPASLIATGADVFFASFSASTGDTMFVSFSDSTGVFLLASDSTGEAERGSKGLASSSWFFAIGGDC